MMIELNFPNAVTSTANYFVHDEDEELVEIQKILKSSSRQPIAIMGERRIGKTSLLNVVTEWLGQTRVATALPVPHAYSRDDLAAEILQGVCTQVGSNLRQTGLFNDQGQFKLVTIGEFVTITHHLIAKASNPRFVLSIDEFDSLLEKCNDATAIQILDFVLYLIENTSLPLHFLFTMTQSTQRILRSYATPFTHVAKLIPLTPWSYEKSHKFLNWLLKKRLIFNEISYREFFAAAGGHPFFVKALIQSLMDICKREPEGFHITTKQIQPAVESTTNLPVVDLSLENIFNVHFSKQAQELLIRIASVPTGLNRDVIARMGNEYDKVADQLVRRGYIYLKGDVHYLRIGIMANWMKKKHLTVDDNSRVFHLPAIKGNIQTLTIDDSRGLVYLGEQEIQLTHLEHGVLRCLGQLTGQLVKKEVLARRVWPEEEYAKGFGDARIDAVISRLRRKLGDDARNHIYLETRPNQGYILHNATYIPSSTQ